MATESPLNDRVEKDNVPTIRLENEDDDGYDPWSDRRVEEPLFEPDPWN